MMKNKWKLGTIGDYCTVGDGAHASIKRQLSGVMYLTSKNFKKSGLDLSKIDYISQSDYKKYFKKNSNALTKPHSNDLLVSIIGSLGASYIMKKNDVFGLSSSVAIIRPNNNLFDSRYIYYYFLSSIIQKHIYSIKSGVAQGFLSLDMIRCLPLLKPPLPIQKKIAAVLSAYDDLIENNNRRIAILEKMAEEIYREWFVRMRFPGHEKVKFSKGVPGVWEIKKVKEIVERKKFGKIYRENELTEDGQVVVIDQSTKDFLGFYIGKPEHKASIDNPVIIFGDHTCKMQIMIEPFSLAENVIPFKPKNNMPIFFLFYLINNLIETREYKRHWTELTNKQVYMPEEKLQKRFSEIIKDSLLMIKRLQRVNRKLSKSKNLLLPRLIRGKFSLEDLDIKFPPSMEEEDA